MIRLLATVLLVGGAVAVTAPAANADTLTCLAPVTTVQTENNRAIQFDRAGDAASAASAEATAVSYENTARSTCYFNPSVPYSAYQDAINGFSYVDAARAANNVGNVPDAFDDEQTAASYLNAAIALLNRAP
jgi:hypothetical protein